MYKTPYYLLDLQKLDNNLSSMKESFNKKWSNFKIGYSFKTNNLPWLVNWFRKNKVMAEVVSTAEYELAKYVGYQDNEIILNGPYKGYDTIIKVLKGNGIVNLDSFEEISFITANIHQFNDICKVGLRINFDLENKCPGETIPGEEPGRFGFNYENGDFEKAIKELSQFEKIKVVGIHGHHSTKTKSLNVFSAITEMVCKASSFLKCLEYIDLGGCLFGDKPGAPSFDQYASTITDVLNKYKIDKHVTLIMEPGAALIASPFSYLCSALSVKKIKNTTIISTDGSKKHIAPQMNNITFSYKIHRKKDENYCNIIDKQVISGFTCIEMDRFLNIYDKEEILPGDIIEIYNCGAYTLSLAPLFIEYYPKVIVKDRNSYQTVREAWGCKEFVQKNII